MSLLPRLCLVLALSGFGSGCQTTPGAPVAADVTPNAVAGDAIEVTVLDAPPAAPASAAVTGLATVPAQEGSPLQGPGAATVEPAPLPVAADGTTPARADPAETEAAGAEPAEVVPPPPPKTDLQIACERKRGIWEDTGGGLKICTRPTRDGGKRCTRESQCEGLCLARSGTCAPVEPLLGCHDILQDNGTRATQCVE